MDVLENPTPEDKVHVPADRPAVDDLLTNNKTNGQVAKNIIPDRSTSANGASHRNGSAHGHPDLAHDTQLYSVQNQNRSLAVTGDWRLETGGRNLQSPISDI